MDLRTIMNTDAAAASDTASAPPALLPPSLSRQPSSAEPAHPHPQHAASVPNAAYPVGYAGRPPQPAPLQPPHTSPERSSSYSSLQSPYQYSAPAAIPSAPPQPAQSPLHGAATFVPGSRESYSSTSPAAVYGHGQPHPAPGPLASPYTPARMSAGPPQPQYPQQDSPSYFGQSRNYSAQESPPPIASQSVPPQQFSPPGQRSVPGTPLGPPAATYPRVSPQVTRPPSSGYDSQHNRMSSPWTGPDAPTHDQRATTSPSARSWASRPDSRPVDHATRQFVADMERDRTASVSPRTVVTASSRHSSMPEPRVAPIQSRFDDSIRQASPASSAAASAINVGPGYAGPAGATVDKSPSSRLSSTAERPPADPAHAALPQRMDISPENQHQNSKPPPAKRKKIRYSEPPIFARKTARTSGRCPVIPNPRPPVPKHARSSRPSVGAGRQRTSSIVGPPPSAAAPGPRIQGEAVVRTNGPPAPVPPPRVPFPEPVAEGSLGPWEPSITGVIPHEEMTKLICDFLFQHVVLRKEVNAGPAGAAAPSQGAIVEIEAKMGRIIDMDRGERLRLPVLTETVINREDPRFRTSFESSMSLTQHRAMNNFLNEAVKASMPQPNAPRIPVSYAHKKERDTFYEVSAAELPPIIRQNLNPRHRPKVRVTTDQRTGETIAQIVKCRLADLDVYSPRTNVDWRISVNLEIDYDGDVRQLTVLDGAKGGGGGGGAGRGGDRNKDRMSYRHLAYQIDLTQVAKAEPPTKPDFEHELEIEVSAAEVRRQGHLAMSGDPSNQYEDLIKGFVDNIRVLARAVPP